MARGAGTTAIQFALDVGRVQFQAGAAVDNATNGRPVGLAEIRDGEKGTEGIAGHKEANEVGVCTQPRL